LEIKNEVRAKKVSSALSTVLLLAIAYKPAQLQRFEAARTALE
jgi:hypothetical protein